MSDAKSLRTICVELGLTKATTGKTIREIVDLAMAEDNPVGWLHVVGPTLRVSWDAASDPVGDVKEATERVLEDVGLPFPEKSVPQLRPGLYQCSLVVPLGPLPRPPFNAASHVEVGMLNNPAALGLKRLVAGLDELGARTDNGRRVVSGPQAVRWLLEQIGRDASVASDASDASDEEVS